MHGRKYLRAALVVAAPAWAWLTAAAGLGACSSSSDEGTSGPGANDAQAEAQSITPVTVTGQDASPQPVIFGDDAGGGSFDGAPAATCPGSPVPDAMSTACAIDTSSSCAGCASWGFVCATWASPQVQGGNASAFCNANVFDGGSGASALICCTHAACIVSTTTGECDASSQTRYECSGGAVPTGTCEWLGAGAPNDYCCQ